MANIDFLEEEASGFNDLNGTFAQKTFNPTQVRLIMQGKEEDKERRAKDISNILYIYHLKGTNSKKVPDKLSATQTAQFKALLDKYNIRPTSQSVKQKSLTLPIIAAAFPEVVAKLLSSGKIEKNDLLNGLVSDCFPDCIKSPSFASLIPKGCSILSAKLRIMHLQFLYDMDSRVNKIENRSSIDNLIQFRDIAHKSNIVPDNRRYSICASLGLFVLLPDGETYVFSDEVQTAYQALHYDLRERSEFDFDPSVDYSNDEKGNDSQEISSTQKDGTTRRASKRKALESSGCEPSVKKDDVSSSTSFA